MSPLRILVADDHDLMRRGIRMLLEDHKDWEICGEACTGREAIAKSQELKPDIAILDISMPEMDGLNAAKRIREASPKTEILMLSVHCSDPFILEAVDAGVRGYVLKSDSDRDLVTAVETLASHKPFLTSYATRLFLQNFEMRGGSGKEASEGLRERVTSRERDVVQLIAEGKSSREIGAILGISTKTAETHRANIMRKLELHSVGELVRYALRNQIVEA
ncbi:MAG: response regulator transcription factor [Candidatus Acidiferrales bacterium]